MATNLGTFLRREQRAFLRRDRSAWDEHLGRIRGFLAEGLRGAGKGSPVLVLGAGSGLEVPWGMARPGTVGWDADPWSRARTLLRHGRWAPWIFADITGSFAALNQLLVRAVRRPWSGQRRDPATAVARLAGLLPSLKPDPAGLRSWIQEQRPGTILAANFMGQIGVAAAALVESALAPWSPWEEDPEREDPLAEALDAWVKRVLVALLAELGRSGADLFLVHDRGILHGSGPVRLGPATETWTGQIQNPAEFEISDPLCGVDVRAALPVARLDRWLWPVGPSQIHLMEAVFSPGSPEFRPDP